MVLQLIDSGIKTHWWIGLKPTDNQNWKGWIAAVDVD